MTTAVQRSIIICATQRSGSSFFGEALAAQGGVGSVAEWFVPDMVAELKRRYSLPLETGWDPFIRTLVDRETNEQGVFSAKIMWDTLDEMLTELRQTSPQHQMMSYQELVAYYFPNPTYVFVTREDKLRQAVSLAISDQSGVWHKFKGARRYRESTLVFDYELIRFCWSYIDKLETHWRRFFRQYDIKPYTVVYEDFVSHYEETLREVFAHLQLPAPARIRRKGTTLKKLGGSVNADWVRRFQQLDEKVRRHDQTGDLQPLPPEGCRARFTFWQQPPRLLIGQNYPLRVRVRNTGSAVWPAVGNAEPKFWCKVGCHWRNGNGELLEYDGPRGYLPCDVQPGEEVETVIPLRVPTKPGLYLAELDVMQENVIWFSALGNGTATVPIEVALDRATNAAQAYLGPLKTLPNGWKHSAWLGHIQDRKFPWIVHERLGWVFCYGDGLNGGKKVQIFSRALGWIITDPESWPMLLQYETGRWLWLQTDAKRPFIVFDMATGELVGDPDKPGIEY